MSSPQRSYDQSNGAQTGKGSHNQSVDVQVANPVKEDIRKSHFTTQGSGSEDIKDNNVKIKDESIFNNPSEKMAENNARGRDKEGVPFDTAKFNMTGASFNSAGKQEGDVLGFDTLSPRIISSHYGTRTGLASRGE